MQELMIIRDPISHQSDEEFQMTKFNLLAFGLLALTMTMPLVANDPIDDVMSGCAPEIKNFCSRVTPGNGRLAACFYAHEDRLSAVCVNSLYNAAQALDEAIDAFVNIATNCEADIDSYCADVEVGEGRILNCLSSSRDSLSEECTMALDAPEE